VHQSGKTEKSATENPTNKKIRLPIALKNEVLSEECPKFETPAPNLLLVQNTRRNPESSSYFAVQQFAAPWSFAAAAA